MFIAFIWRKTSSTYISYTHICKLIIKKLNLENLAMVPSSLPSPPLRPAHFTFSPSLSFSDHLADLEGTLQSSSSSSSTVVVNNLRAYMHIMDVASILGLDCNISHHAFQLFRDCCSATCLRNRSVEVLARRTLQITFMPFLLSFVINIVDWLIQF